MTLKRILISLPIGAVILLLLFLVMPLSQQLSEGQQLMPLLITDRNEKVLYEVRPSEFGSQKYLAFEDVPEVALSALISTEDKRFYSHWGFDPLSMLRALWGNFQAGQVVSGGSTITQQLVKIRLQPEQRGYWYKFQEAMLSLKLETRLSKAEILEGYLNSAFFGNHSYGLGAAASNYFGKQAQELSLAETSLLIGLLQSPVGYDPYQRFERAKERQRAVLTAMLQEELIDQAQFEEALQEPLQFQQPRVDIKAPHFVFWVLQQIHGMSTGQKVQTTLDLDLQTAVENIVRNELEKLAEKNVSSAAVVVLDAQNGQVLSMVGSADYFDTQRDGQVNVAVSSRQPGSALKPFTYALALAQGDTAATTVADVETQFFTQDGNPYIPRNYDYGYHGLVRYREALANSYNIPAVKVLEKVGVGKLLDFLHSAGITTLENSAEFYGVALTLGSGEVRLLELAQAYGIFPRQGRTLPITYLMDQQAEPGRQIIDPKVAWLISDILSDNQARIPEFGEDSPLSFEYPVAAKTGTTRNSRDNWVIGYTPQHIVGVWVGNADNSPMKDTSGVTGAGPIFHAVMDQVNKNTPPLSFKKPSGVTQQEVCALSGLLPGELCQHTLREWFVSGTEPRTYDNLHQKISIDSRNNLLAHQGCDPYFLQEKTYVVFPVELKKWARENGYEQPPVQYSTECGEEIFSEENMNQNDEHFLIRRPNNRDSFLLDPLIPDEHERITFEAEAPSVQQHLSWAVDQQVVAEVEAPDFRFQWYPTPGVHTVHLLNSSTDNCREEWLLEGENYCLLDTVQIEVIQE